MAKLPTGWGIYQHKDYVHRWKHWKEFNTAQSEKVTNSWNCYWRRPGCGWRVRDHLGRSKDQKQGTTRGGW